MINSTPGFIDPYKLAKNGQALHGKVAIADMLRANQSLTSADGEVEYNMAFATDTEGYCVITGDLETKLHMRCQRCLQEFVTKVQSTFAISPVADNKEAKLLPDYYDPVILEDAKLYPAELVEDELILAMPIVPLHEVGAVGCVEIVGSTVAEVPRQEPANPFKVLQALKVTVENKGQLAEDK
jgi:uncharacterized protein